MTDEILCCLVPGIHAFSTARQWTKRLPRALTDHL
jgi:hypothetical protein